MPSLKKLNSLRKDSFLIDIIVLCGDMMFSGHKIILAENSPYFQKLFQNETGHEVLLPLENEKYTPEAIMCLLNFMYEKTLDFDTNKPELFAAAKYLEMEEIIELLLHDVLKNVDVPSFLAAWDLVEIYGSKWHEEQILNFVVVNLKKVTAQEEFMYLHQSRLTSLLKCIKCQLQHVVTQDLVLNAVFKWAKFDENCRAQFLPILVPMVDLTKIPAYIIINIMEDESRLACSVSLPLVKALCPKLWHREEVFIFINECANQEDVSLEFFNPATGKLLDGKKKIQKSLFSEGIICSWKKFIYFITETKITAFNIETNAFSTTNADLISYDMEFGKVAANGESLYHVSQHKLDEFRLNSKDKQWRPLPSAPFDFVSPITLCAQEFLIVINNDLTIQRFDPKIAHWESVETTELYTPDDSGVVAYHCNGHVYIYANKEPEMLRIFHVESLKIVKKQLVTKCPLTKIKLMHVKELTSEKVDILMLDSNRTPWKYTEPITFGPYDLILPKSSNKLSKFSFGSNPSENTKNVLKESTDQNFFGKTAASQAVPPFLTSGTNPLKSPVSAVGTDQQSASANTIFIFGADGKTSAANAQEKPKSNGENGVSANGSKQSRTSFTMADTRTFTFSANRASANGSFRTSTPTPGIFDFGQDGTVQNLKQSAELFEALIARVNVSSLMEIT